MDEGKTKQGRDVKIKEDTSGGYSRVDRDSSYSYLHIFFLLYLHKRPQPPTPLVFSLEVILQCQVLVQVKHKESL